MCDHESYKELRERVAELEKGAARFDEQIKGLYRSTTRLFYTTLSIAIPFGLLMLLALIYGAIGHRGFNAVTDAANAAGASAAPARSAR